MITSCAQAGRWGRNRAHAGPAESALACTRAALALPPLAARTPLVLALQDDARWRLIKLGPGAPTGGGSRELLEWAKSREATSAGYGLDQARRSTFTATQWLHHVAGCCVSQDELERFAKRVVHLFTEEYTKKTIKRGKLVEGGMVRKSLSESCALLRTVDKRFPRSLDVFDFSERRDAPLPLAHACDVARPRLPTRSRSTSCPCAGT